MTQDLNDRMKQLEAKWESHMEEYHERQIRQDVAHAQNMEAIRKLTEATQGLVDAWRFATATQRFVKWLSGFAFVGVLAKIFFPELFQ